MKTTGTFFLILLFFSFKTFANDIKKSVVISEAEISKAFESFKESNLEHSRGWQKLLHRERNMFGLKTIQITDEKFLLKNNFNDHPKYNHLNELEATFISFFEDPKGYEKLIDPPISKFKKEGEKIADFSTHAICRFPARLKFIKQNLPSQIWNQLPKPRCIFQEIFLEAVNPKSISFVFSSYYSDSPGSAFGHTFFRVNRKKSNELNRQELLDFGIGYAANVTTSNGALYALLGLVGGFTGSWTNLPYYYKVREYNDFESRDLWSYGLNLTDDEVEMLVLHFWEIGEHYYRYYFFTQNCAFHMLTALEAAAPRLHLIDHVPFYYVIPSDSMKALFYEPGLVANVTFRPSLRHTFLERSSRVQSDSINLLKNFSLNADAKIFEKMTDQKERALTLDAALDLVDLKMPFNKGETDEERAHLKTKESLLLQRAKIDYISPELVIPMNTLEDPSQSHGSSRATLNYFEKNEIKSGFLEYRFALHDLLDPAQGLPKNSQLEFFNLKFQLLPEHFKFSEGKLFNVFNLNPLNFFERKLSWGMELGVQNKLQYCDPTEYACYLSGGRGRVGYSINLGSEQTTAWVMGAANIRHGDRLLKSKKLFLAPGFEVGLHHRFSNNQALITTFGREYPIDFDYEQNYEFQYRISFWQKIAFSGMIINDNYGLGLNYYY